MKTAITILVSVLLTPLGLLAQGDNPGSPQIQLLGDGQTINCTDAPVTIGVKVKHWQPGFTYAWSNGATDSVITVKPNSTRVYQIQVQNETIGFNETRSIEVRVKNDPIDMEVATIDIDKHTCPGKDILLQAQFSGGHAPYTYTWSNGQTVAAPIVKPEENTTYSVTVVDACGTTESGEVNVRFEEDDPLSEIPEQTRSFTCDDDLVVLDPSLEGMSGGVGYGYSYTFNTWDERNKIVTVHASEGQVIEYTVTDACGFQEVRGTITLEKEEIEVPTPGDITVCKGAEVSITNEHDEFYFWDGEKMHVSYTAVYENESTVELMYIDVCGGSHMTAKHIRMDVVPTDFEMEVNHLDRTVQLRAPQMEEGTEIAWYLNGQKVSVEPDPKFDLVEAEENLIELEVENEAGCTEKAARTLVLQEGVKIPTAFSPNGDGVNDFFSVRFADELAQFEIKIFDRWGQLIYHSRDQYFEWNGMIDGQTSPLANYAYILRAETVEGRNIEKRGTISTLIFK